MAVPTYQRRLRALEEEKKKIKAEMVLADKERYERELREYHISRKNLSASLPSDAGSTPFFERRGRGCLFDASLSPRRKNRYLLLRDLVFRAKLMTQQQLREFDENFFNIKVSIPLSLPGGRSTVIENVPVTSMNLRLRMFEEVCKAHLSLLPEEDLAEYRLFVECFNSRRFTPIPIDSSTGQPYCVFPVRFLMLLRGEKVELWWPRLWITYAALAVLNPDMKIETELPSEPQKPMRDALFYV